MVQQLYQGLQHQPSLHLLPPRYTFRGATRSGIAHQFDIIVRQDRLVAAIECKFREKTGIDELFAFVGKLIDYRDPPSGVFATTSESVHDEVFCYAIAHHIRVICLTLPPIEYMSQKVRDNTDLARRLNSLQMRLEGDNKSPSHVLVEWKNAYRRFLAEGYSE